MTNISPHWIKRNETSRVPNRWVFLDTEAVQETEHGRTLQSWRLGVTCFDNRDTKSKIWRKPEWVYHLQPEGLWKYVSGVCRAGQRTICVAHNMGYDARISDAFRILPAMGWNLERWQVGDRSCVIRWRKNGTSLWLVDSTGWLPMSLEKVGGLVDLPKQDLPDWDASQEMWWARCHTDVAILRRAMLDCLEWVRSDDLGNWQATAGSMAWANWRHKHYTDRVLVHDNREARDAERSACYAGRCEAWKHGRLPGGKWTEWDLPLAYPRVALDTPLPTMLRSHVKHPSIKYLSGATKGVRWLCYAHVDTDVPTLPVAHNGNIVWPVGRLEGWYWDRELTVAMDNGAKVKLSEGYRYAATYALSDWATWIIDCVESNDERFTLLQQAVAKGWARALIGRFGTRYRTWEDWGESESDDVRMGYLVDYATRTVGRTLNIGGRQYAATVETDGVESVPSIMSAIMSECRVRLWQMMNVAGLENISYVDTDSLLVNPKGSSRLRAWTADGNGWGLREKHTYSSLTVMGPR